jgi:hypothetical protein
MANPRIRFTLGSHVRFGNLDFICMGVDYNLVLLPPSINIDVISEALSNLRLGTNEGQAPENDYPGGSQGRVMPIDLTTHHAQAITEVLTTTEIAFSTSSDEDDSS